LSSWWSTCRACAWLASRSDPPLRIALCRQLNFTQPLAEGLATLAWIRQSNGDPAGALEAMSEAGKSRPVWA
jgi:hypothetical protein